MGYFLTFPKLVLSEEGELDGSDRFLWTALERDLNFTSNLTKCGVQLLFTVLTGNFASLSRIGNAGKQSGIGGEWDGLVGELLAGNIDVSMNVMAVRYVSNIKLVDTPSLVCGTNHLLSYISFERSLVMDYSRPVQVDSMFLATYVTEDDQQQSHTILGSVPTSKGRIVLFLFLFDNF